MVLAIHVMINSVAVTHYEDLCQALPSVKSTAEMITLVISEPHMIHMIQMALSAWLRGISECVEANLSYQVCGISAVKCDIIIINGSRQSRYNYNVPEFRFACS